MPSHNKVQLMGNLTRDIELRYTPSGKAVADLGLAINNKYKKGDDWVEEVTFVDVTLWGKLAENCAEYLEKGKACFIEGRLKFEQWETDDGDKRSKLKVEAITVQFLNQQMNVGGAKDRPEKDDIPF